MPIIGKPLLVFGSLAGVSLLSAGSYFAASALDSQQSTTSDSNQDLPKDSSSGDDTRIESSQEPVRNDSEGSPQGTEDTSQRNLGQPSSEPQALGASETGQAKSPVVSNDDQSGSVGVSGDTSSVGTQQQDNQVPASTSGITIKPNTQEAREGK